MFKQLLVKELKKRQKKNPKYSLRSFARDLKISPSMISRFISGDREPSPESLVQILELIDIDSSLKKQLLDSLHKNIKLNIPQDEDYQELSSAQIEKLNHWLYFALLELFRSNNRKFTPLKIAKSLNQPTHEIESKIQTLIAMGLLKKTESSYKTVNSKQTAKTSRKTLDQIHSGYIDQAKNSMVHSKEEERNISGTTILISPHRLTEAYERIKTFRRSLASYLEIKDAEKEEKLYRIQIALFPLEK